LAEGHIHPLGGAIYVIMTFGQKVFRAGFLGRRCACPVVYTQVRNLLFLAEGLFFTVAWGKRSAALGNENLLTCLAEGHIHLSAMPFG